MSIGIVTDTGCDLPQALEEELRINTVPLIFRFGLEEFPDKSIPMSDFLERVKVTWPTSSAPSPGVFIEAIRTALETHEHVLCITITGKHSATYSSAETASQQFPSGQVTVFDSTSLSIGHGYMVAAAARAAQAGAEVPEILALLKDLQQRVHLYIVLDTLDNLVKGGRASQTAGFLAQVLKIRPILTLKDGQLTVCEKPRGRAASKQKLLEMAASHFPAEHIAVGHVGCEEEAGELAATIAELTGIPVNQIPVIEASMAIAVHCGKGTLGILVVSR